MSVLALLAVQLSSLHPATRGVPACDTPGHGRLIVQADRDVCAATLDRRQRPMAIGFLPTRCAEDGMDYRIDAIGPRDRCTASNK